MAKATNKTTTVAKTSASAAENKVVDNKEVIKTPAAETKASKARVILSDMFGAKEVPARKDMIAALVKEVELTPAGAATYLQNYKRDNGLTKNAVVKGEPATA